MTSIVSLRWVVLIWLRGSQKVKVFNTLIPLSSGKSLGPYGFNIEFYERFWNIIGDDLFLVIQHFFLTSSMTVSLNNTFITLIPKKDKPRCVSDFQPISLCNVCYKIIAKILANKMLHVLPMLINKEENVFIPSRNIIYNIILIQEATHSINNGLKTHLGWSLRLILRRLMRPCLGLLFL